MRISDDYNAKFEIWTRDPKPQPEIPGPKLPKFSPKRFSSYAEMNAWKEELINQMIRERPNSEGNLILESPGPERFDRISQRVSSS